MPNMDVLKDLMTKGKLSVRDLCSLTHTDFDAYNGILATPVGTLDLHELQILRPLVEAYMEARIAYYDDTPIIHLFFDPMTPLETIHRRLKRLK